MNGSGSSALLATKLTSGDYEATTTAQGTNVLGGSGPLVAGVTASNSQATTAAAAGAGAPVDVSLTPGLASGITGWITSLEQTLTGGITGAVSDWLGSLENWFGRGFLIVIGLVIVGIALVFILGQQKVVQNVAKAAMVA